MCQNKDQSRMFCNKRNPREVGDNMAHKVWRSDALVTEQLSLNYTYALVKFL